MAHILRGAKPAYTARRPVPTINSYVREQQQRSAQALSPEDEDFSDDETRLDDDDDDNDEPGGKTNELGKAQSVGNHLEEPVDNHDSQSAVTKDTSEAVDGQGNLKQRRKDFGKRRKLRRRREREVTDPVTHLPVRIYDFQPSDLADVPDSLITLGAKSGRLTGVAGKSKSDEELRQETDEIDRYHAELDTRFPPPDYEAVKKRLVGIYSQSIVVGLSAVVAVAYAVSCAEAALGSRRGFLPFASEAAIGSLGFLAVAYAIYGARQWMANRVDDIWEEELWRAEKTGQRRPEADDNAGARSIADMDPASTRWLNDMLSSLWPLVNPDLFFGVADTLEVGFDLSLLPIVPILIDVTTVGRYAS